MSTGKSNWKISEFVAHGADVLCAGLSPSNGRILATGGEDKRINLWLVGQPHNITSITGLSSPVESVVFNNTEDWLGAGSHSGSLKVFDLNANTVVRNISGHKSSIKCLDFHRYGDILASGSLDTNIKLWDVRRKGCLYTYKGHTESVNALQFSPDGRWLVSASSDNTVRLWDLNAAKCLKQFNNHTAPINDIQFHPKELLLASAGNDRIINYWDLETFSLISTSPPEGYSIRNILFHPDGNALFSAGQDSLRVHGWEPPNQYDYLPVTWGKISSMQLSGDQLIGVSYTGTIVSLWCVDVKRLKPWSAASNSSKGCPSARQHFKFQEEVISQRPMTRPSGPPQNLMGDGDDEQRGGDSPPIEVKDEDRLSVFKTREQLVRTPPKQLHLKPFQPPIVEAPPTRHTYNVPSLDMPHPASSEKELDREINSAHNDVCSWLSSRLSLLKDVRAEWSVYEPKASLEVAINSGSQPVIVDLLSVLNLKRSLWTLDMAILVLPEDMHLLKSRHQNYIMCAITNLKLLLKSFSSVIIANIRHPSTPTNAGIDIAKEERIEKCETCYAHLCKIRNEIISSPPSSLLSRMAKEHNLLDTFNLLK